ncbi:MAG: phosphoglucosamine mutase [Peptococcaceae bacterium]|nr:phosphoglucosamine mutase [Peptococcaceae bacterium]
MAKLFGTDGVRGKAGEVLTAELAMKLGQAAGRVFLEENGGKTGAVIVGRDTRISGQMLECALTAGLTSVGLQVISAGVVPTPAVAFLVRNFNALAGGVISASHNPYEDNGIKFFSATGTKLRDDQEAAIEAALQGELPIPVASGKNIGRYAQVEEAVEAYKDFLSQMVNVSGSRYRVVVDCANGAASSLAQEVFERAKLDVVMMGDQPNGSNINVNCGSTHLAQLQERVVAEGADVGLAFDGDADRFLAVDEKGRVVDGDHLMAIYAKAMKEENRLVGNKLVVTVMSNLGLKLAMRDAGIDIVETNVGDRYVNEGLLETGAVLGGEQSGHIIFREYNSTGDGMISAIMLLNVMNHKRVPLSELADAAMTSLPQVLVNVPVRSKEGWQEIQAIQEAIAKAETALGEEGRVLVRASGTEQLLRVMVEGKDQKNIEMLANAIADVVREAIGA